MRVLRPILRQLVYPTLGRARYFRSRARPNVLTYHGVLPQGYHVADSLFDNNLMHIEAFRTQLKTLKRYYNVISPDQFHLWLRGFDDLPERAVLLTCDDGLLNNVTVMAPLLEEEGLPCLFFVTGSSVQDAPQMLWYIELYLMLMECPRGSRKVEWQGVQIPAIEDDSRDRRSQWLMLMSRLSAFDATQRREFLREAAEWWCLAPDWKTRYLDDPLLQQRFQLLGAKDLRRLAEAGGTIGAHTMSHPELSRLPEELAAREIINCRRELELSTGSAIWALAYPFGDPAAVGNREIQIARGAGYECAFMNIPGMLRREDRFAVPRVNLTADMSLSVFEAYASGFDETWRAWLRRSGSSNGRDRSSSGCERAGERRPVASATSRNPNSQLPENQPAIGVRFFP